MSTCRLGEGPNAGDCPGETLFPCPGLPSFPPGLMGDRELEVRDLVLAMGDRGLDMSGSWRDRLMF